MFGRNPESAELNTSEQMSKNEQGCGGDGDGGAEVFRMEIWTTS